MRYIARSPEAEHATSTGLNNRKLLMWAFLGSDAMFFGPLIATHLIYRTQASDIEAFNPLVEKYHLRVYTHILGVVQREHTVG